MEVSIYVLTHPAMPNIQNHHIIKLIQFQNKIRGYLFALFESYAPPCPQSR